MEAVVETMAKHRDELKKQDEKMIEEEEKLKLKAEGLQKKKKILLSIV